MYFAYFFGIFLSGERKREPGFHIYFGVVLPSSSRQHVINCLSEICLQFRDSRRPYATAIADRRRRRSPPPSRDRPVISAHCGASSASRPAVSVDAAGRAHELDRRGNGAGESASRSTYCLITHSGSATDGKRYCGGCSTVMQRPRRGRRRRRRSSGPTRCFFCALDVNR